MLNLVLSKDKTSILMSMAPRPHGLQEYVDINHYNALFLSRNDAFLLLLILNAVNKLCQNITAFLSMDGHVANYVIGDPTSLCNSNFGFFKASEQLDLGHGHFFKICQKGRIEASSRLSSQCQVLCLNSNMAN